MIPLSFLLLLLFKSQNNRIDTLIDRKQGINQMREKEMMLLYKKLL